MRCMSFCPKEAIEASHLLAIGYYYLAAIPIGFITMNWLSNQIPFIKQINGLLINSLLQYGYMLLSFAFTYYVLQQLIKIKFFNRLFSYGTLTRYYKRYRKPKVKLTHFK